MMKLDDRQIMVCNCGSSMDIDAKKLAKACGAADGCEGATELCRGQIERFDAALRENAGAPLIVASFDSGPKEYERPGSHAKWTRRTRCTKRVVLWRRWARGAAGGAGRKWRARGTASPYLPIPGVIISACMQRSVALRNMASTSGHLS